MKKIDTRLARIFGIFAVLLLFLSGCSNLAISDDPVSPQDVKGVASDGGSKGNQTGTHDGFYYSFWDDDQGSVNWTLGSAGNYSVSWNTSGNCVGGKGWQTGSSSRIIGYNAGYFNPGSNGYLCLYGWTRNPLIEYYVVEAHGGYTPGGSSQGTVTTDGKTYQLGRTQRVQQPSIDGTQTFYQYWSVRNGSTGSDETITFANHVSAWASKGWNLGTHYYQILATEGYNSSGGSDVTVWEANSSSSSSSSSSNTDSSSSSGSNTIVVRAKGTSGSEHIQLVVGSGNTVIGQWTLGTSYANYTASTDLSGGIAVVYDNDASGRDVQVDYITVNGSTRQAEDQSTNTAVYQNGSCGGSNSEYMHCDGYIGFGDVSSSSTSTNTGTTTGTTTGSNTIVVRAKGTAGSEHIQLVVGDGNTVVGQWTLGTSYANYTASTSLSGGIAVVFDNDASGRDVQVDYITVNGSTRQAEDQSTNTAVYQNGSCGGSNSEYMHCDGYIGFGDVSGSSTSTSTGTTTGTNGSVYLCFDDGPNNSTSQSLVNALVSAGATKATMFPIASNISSNSTGMNAYKNAGFSIQNHSYSHSHMTGWGYSQVYNDLNQANQTIQNAGCAKPTRIRLPYLESNSTIQSVCSALGLSIVSPNVDTQDWNGASASAIASAVSSLQAGGNILAHDGYWTTISAIPTMVSNLKNRGLGFAQY